MKRILLAAFILSLAVFASGYTAKQVSQQIVLESLDIMEYVTAPAGTHDSDWYLEVTDGIDVASTATHVPARIRVETKMGPGGLAAWATLDMQAFPTVGPSAGLTLNYTLTYLPNEDPETNTFTWSKVLPTGTAAVWWAIHNGEELYLPESILGGDTYTLNLTTDPAGHITSPAPVEDPEDLYGTYAPTTSPEGPGYWEPEELVIDADTPWVEGEDGNYTYDFEFVWTIIPPTYTLNLSTDPAGHITSPAPTTDVEDLYGTYAPSSNPEGPGAWIPTNIVIDANTVWEDDGDDYKLDVVFTWDPTIYVDNYRVKVVTSDDAVHAIALDGVAVGTTPYTAEYVLDKAEFYGVWTVTDAEDCWYTPVEISEDTVFTELRGKGADGRATINRYFEYTINFQRNEYHAFTVMVIDVETDDPIPNASVYFQGEDDDDPILMGTTNSEGAYTVICPGNYPGAGTWTVAHPDYWLWMPDAIYYPEAFLLENDMIIFTGESNRTYTLILTTNPEGHIESPEPSTDVEDLWGTYAPTSDPEGDGHWEPENLVIDEDTEWIEDEDGNFRFAVEFVWIPKDITPVELSSFTATLSGDFFVNIAWTSQTETQMMGYRVYRNTTADQSSAMMIDNPMVPATNSSESHTYNVTDTDVMIGETYYYWLEAVEYNASNFHGPVSVTVTGNVPPVLPEVTTMKNAYPNPFKAGSSTNIEVALKAGESGTLTIYNVMGQVVKTVSLTEGSHMVSWNGRDAKGSAVGNDIYFYKLSTPSLNQTKKMVIVK